jgi:hypothetical protein
VTLLPFQQESLYWMRKQEDGVWNGGMLAVGCSPFVAGPEKKSKKTDSLLIICQDEMGQVAFLKSFSS